MKQKLREIAKNFQEQSNSIENFPNLQILDSQVENQSPKKTEVSRKRGISLVDLMIKEDCKGKSNSVDVTYEISDPVMRKFYHSLVNRISKNG
jgi:hypothetical protein